MNNKTLRMRLKKSVLAMALATLPLAAGAAGMGRIAVISALGQPLRAEIELTANSDELASLSARVASADAFKRAGIEFSSALPNIRFSVEKRANGQPYLSMRSDQAFSEPFLDVLVEMTWASGRMVREYTFLLDPPDSKAKPISQVAPVTLPVAPTLEPKKDSPAAPASAPQPAAPAIPASPKAGDEMKVVRGADGVQRIVKASPSADKSSQHQVTHTVKRGETLHRIAVETKPEGVSLDQMLVALFRSNPDAFDHGNIHRLRAGKILNIPDQEAAAAIDSAEAHEVVMAQSSDFNAYRKKLAASVAGAHEEAEEAPKQAASGKIAPQVKDHAPPPTAGKDKLEISKSEVAKGKGGKGDAGGRIGAAALEEELLARDNALKEANARIAELDKNLKDLRNLVEMKNQGMADLQKQAQTPQSPAPAQPPQEVAAAPEKTAEPAAEKPAEPSKPAAEVKKAPPPPPPEPEPEPDFIQDNPELLFGGAGILTLLLGYLGYARWRKKKQEDELGAMSPMSVTEETPSASQFASSGGQIVDTGSTENNSLQTDFSLAGGGIAGPSEGVDPIAEADVYMAYGRTAQAEEILLDALKNDPTRLEIHLKLLEIYAASKSVKQYEAIAVDLHQLTHASGPAWEKAARQGRQLDPQNSLYSDKPASQDEFDPAATMMLTPQDLGKMHEDEAENEMMQTAIMEQPVEPAQDGGDKEIVPESLDFDLDLGSDSAAAPAAEAPAKPESEPETAAVTDFDFDLGAPEGEPAAEVSAQAEPTAPETVGDVDFDFDLGDEGKETKADAPEEAASPTKENNEVEFDLDLSVPEPSPAAGEGEATSMTEDIKLPDTGDGASTAGSDLDFDFDLDSNAGAPAAEQSAAPSASASGVDLSSISLELDDVKPQSADTEAIDLGIDLPDAAAAAEPAAASEDEPDLPEVTTKLELAQAYEEMGDKDGARELLEEVLNEGSSRQKALARDKLALLG